MKKIVLIYCLLLLSISCNTSPVSKPEKLLSEEEMVAVLYDIAILQATQNYKPIILAKHKLDVNNYVFKKHEIDSTIYSQNHKYYASQPKVYKNITNKVLEQIQKQEVTIDSLTKPLEIDKERPKEIQLK